VAAYSGLPLEVELVVYGVNNFEFLFQLVLIFEALVRIQ